MLSDVSAPSLEATVNGLPERRGAVETLLADVSEVAEVEAVVACAVERFGRLDVLISNAGVLSPNGRIHNLTTEDWERAFRVNVLGAVNGIRAAVPVMRAQQSGSIILTASVVRSHRVVARRAVLRDEGGRDPAREGRGGRVRARRDPRQLRVPRDVPVGDPRRACRRRRSTRSRPSIRSGSATAADLVGAYSYLASDASRWTTGSAIVVDGGYAAP